MSHLPGFAYDNDAEPLEEWQTSLPTMSLFDAKKTLPNPSAAIADALSSHGFDFVSFSKNMDEYGRIKAINCMRAMCLGGASPEDIIAEASKGAALDDAYLKPALAEDPLLFEVDYDGDDDAGDESDDARDLQTENALLRAQLAQCQEALQRALLAEKSVVVAKAEAPASEEAPAMKDAYYFDSYSHFDIHEEMLRDAVRTESYKAALSHPVVKSKRVLDVGCGTGILSMFAASAGASEVVGVDLSAMVEKARAIVDANGLSGKIQLLRARLEELEALPVTGKKVDIIVSEWMGYALLYESMLDSVLDARDKYLAPGGLMMPSSATIFVEAVSDEAGHADKFGFWGDVYGFDMSSVVDVPVREPSVTVVDPSLVRSAEKCALKKIDIATVTKAELDFRAPFSLRVAPGTKVTSFLISFDCTFEIDGEVVATLPTGCEVTPTHWKQTLMWLREPIEVSASGEVAGYISYKRNADNPRFIDFVLECEAHGVCQLYAMT